MTADSSRRRRFLRTQQRLALKRRPGDMTLRLTSAEFRSGVEATAIKLAAKASSGKPPLKDREVLDRPIEETTQQLNMLEKMAGGPLPVSLRAWYEQVGGASLLGYPLAPRAPDQKLHNASADLPRRAQHNGRVRRLNLCRHVTPRGTTLSRCR